ncbi:MAG: thioredoxin family protein [Candidatus Diapherotrites archaeon]
MKLAIISSLKEFTKSKFNLSLIIVMLVLGSFLIFSEPVKPAYEYDGFVVTYFYLPSCSHCAEQKPIILELQQELKDITFVFHDASSQEGSVLFYQMATEAGMDTSQLGTPTTFVENHPLVGVHSKQEILNEIDDCIKECTTGEVKSEVQDIETGFADFELPFLGRTDLTSFSIPVLAIVLGAIDGFNPCAMWVLVYLIALLVNVRDRKKVWLIVGSFVLASGILYFLFMTAWLNVFLLLGYIKTITVIIGLVALGGGILSVKDFLTTKDAMTCKVGDEASHKKTISKMEEIIAKPISLALILGIVALAFVVNSVEFVCSAAIPAVFTQILALSNLSTIEHYMYILLYDIFFMLDDLLIFGLAALAINSSFGEKYAKYCKIIGGIILVVLGLILLFAPHLLR